MADANTRESTPGEQRTIREKNAFWLEKDGEDRGSRLRATGCVVGSV